MLPSEYINNLHVSDDEREELSHTYRGLIMLDNLIGDAVKHDDTPLSVAMSSIDVLKKVILNIITNES